MAQKIKMNNTIIYLIGFPGTGKLTIAKELCKAAAFKLVDNHLINNPVFGLIERDGITPLPDDIWRHAHKIREAILETIKTLSPPEYSFAFTNVLVDDDWVDRAIYDLIEDTAKARNAHFVPVRLTCELEENMRRITSPERKENMKELSPEAARKIRADKTIITLDHPNLLNLDVTDIPAEEAARLILDHAKSRHCEEGHT